MSQATVEVLDFLKALVGRMQALETRLGDTSSRQDALDEGLSRVDARMASVDDRVGAVDNRFSSLERQVAEMRSMVADRSSSLEETFGERAREIEASLVARLDALEQTIGTRSEDTTQPHDLQPLLDMRATVESIEQRIGALATEAAAARAAADAQAERLKELLGDLVYDDRGALGENGEPVYVARATEEQKLSWDEISRRRRRAKVGWGSAAVLSVALLIVTFGLGWATARRDAPAARATFVTPAACTRLPGLVAASSALEDTIARRYNAVASAALSRDDAAEQVLAAEKAMASLRQANAELTAATAECSQQLALLR